MNIVLIIRDEDENETEHSFPAKFAVCGRCDGHGSVMNPSMANHCYTEEEFNETFHDPEDRAEYFKRGGIYDIVCPTCKGERVELVVNESGLSKKDSALLAEFRASEVERLAELEAERRTMYYENGGY